MTFMDVKEVGTKQTKSWVLSRGIIIASVALLLIIIIFLWWLFQGYQYVLVPTEISFEAR